MKLTDYIILAVVFILVILSIHYMIKNRKKGKCIGCCGDCSQCFKNLDYQNGNDKKD